MSADTLKEVPRATPKITEPFVSGCCEGEPCSMCGAPSARKVEEAIFPDDPNPNRHGLSAYVCLAHFNAIVSPSGESVLVPAAELRSEIAAIDNSRSVRDDIDTVIRLKKAILRWLRGDTP